MGIADLFVPTPAKQQEMMTTLLQGQTMNVMASTKFGSASSIKQSVNIIANGNGSVNKGVNISQVANINVKAFLNDSMLIDLKSDLKQTLKNAIKNEGSNFPINSEPNINTKISNVVDNSIDQKFTRTSMMELNNSIDQAVNVFAIAAGNNDDIKVIQTASVISEFTASIGSDISSKLIANTTSDNTTDTKTNDFITGAIKAVGDGIGGIVGPAIFGALAIPVMLFVMFICVVVAIVYVLKGGKSAPATVYVREPVRESPDVQKKTTASDLGIDVSKLPSL